VAGTILANLVTDAHRKATQAGIGFTANGMMRAPLLRGKTGVLTVYDVFAVAPLGAGVVDPTAGSAPVTGDFTGQELKNILEFFFVDSSAHPASIFRGPPACGSVTTSSTSEPASEVDAADRGRHRIRVLLGRGRRNLALSRLQPESRAQSSTT